VQTKGPWEFNIFEEYPEKRGGYFVYSPGIKSCIAKLNTTGDHSDYDPEKSEAHDNARLIAAAPDLLGGCKSALSAIEGIRKQYPNLGNGQLDKAHGMLRDAVTKATGITSMRSIRQASRV